MRSFSHHAYTSTRSEQECSDNAYNRTSKLLKAYVQHSQMLDNLRYAILHNIDVCSSSDPMYSSFVIFQQNAKPETRSS